MQLLGLVLLGACLIAKSSHSIREGKFLWNTVTNIKTKIEVVTSLAPSSCVQVEATLPPCRGVRHLEPFPRFFNVQVPNPYTQSVGDAKGYARTNATTVAKSTMGWAEYFGLVAPTITITQLDRRTTTIHDPRAVVTFVVKGCKPSKLPLGLDKCPDEISPTPQALFIQTTTTTGVFAHNMGEVEASEQMEIRPSNQESETNRLSRVKTEPLQDVHPHF